MRRLKIVLVMVEPPLPFGNAASRWFYVLLKQLVKRGHHVTAFAACSKKQEIQETRELFPADQYTLHLYPFPPRRRLAGKLTTVLKPYSFQFSADLKKDLATRLQSDHDILHLEQLWAGWLGRGHRRRALLNIHHLQAIDLEFARVGPLKEKFNRQLIFSTEKRLVSSYDFIRSCSPRLVPLIRHWNSRATIDTVPVGIDASLYRFLPDERRGTAKVISLIGSMTWYPGQSAAFRLLDRLWPRIRDAVPEARLQIVGWAARSVLKDYLDQPCVDVFENVPEIQPYFDNTSLMLYAPARGSGMKIKVLEALAFGIPVVTTSEGSEGIPAVDGVHMALSEDDDGLIRRAIELLQSAQMQNEMRKKGRELLEQHCGPKKTVDETEELYRHMIDARATKEWA